MLKQRISFVSFCAALCAAPLLAIFWPSQTASFASTPQSLSIWQRGLTLGLAVLALLAWRLNQNRLAVVAGGLAAAAAAVMGMTAAGRPSVDVTNAWLVTVPSGLALCLLPPESAFFSGRNFSRIALLVLPAGLAWAVATSNPVDTAQWLGWHLWGGGPGHANQPSHLAHLSLLIFALVAWRRHARIESALQALGGSLLGLAALGWGIVLSGSKAQTNSRLWLAGFLAQAICVALGLFLLYWQRVYLDELTAIPNRRALDERLGHLDRGYSVAMVDIDHFKKFNDTYGHAQGDDVLRMVAQHLKDQTADRAYRYGGEEFCILAPNLSAGDLAALMDRVRDGLAAKRFHVRQTLPARQKAGPKGRGKPNVSSSEEVQVTVSVGVACVDRKNDNATKVLKLADEGLYDAKGAGRNRVVKKN